MKISTVFFIIYALVSCANSDTERKKSFTSDDEFLDYIQRQHFEYMWSGAEPTSGLARERIHIDGIYSENDQDVITTGGSGFGIAGVLVGIERGFITREEGVVRFEKIVKYLKNADRYKGVWSHWIEGKTGKTKPFGKKDNGGDLVESAFLMQGLICVREYFKNGTEREKKVARGIDSLWREMDWNWYTKGEDVLYWHWSPNYAWEMNFPLKGYNECLITYILAASSPTHPVKRSAYYKGWLSNGDMISKDSAYGYPLRVKHNYAEKMGGPMFWAHYSYIGFNPKGLQDSLGIDYWSANVSHTKINYEYCKENPKRFKSYSDSAWGLTASYSINGYAAHCPKLEDDLGVITPTASLSSFPYAPAEAMKALKYFYNTLGDSLWGDYGFYDAYSVDASWYPKRYLAIDQCTIAPMIENYRTGLLWNLFMNAPEIKQGLKELGFRYNNK